MNFTQKSLFLLLSKALISVISLITSVLLARHLGAAGVGQYQLLVSTQVIIVALMAMGFGNASVYFTNKLQVQSELIISTLFKFFGTVSLFFACLFFVFVLFNDNYFGVLQTLSLIIFAVGASCLLLFSVLSPTLYANLDVVKLQIVSSISSIVMIVGLLLLILFDHFSLSWVLTLTGLGNSFASLLLIILLRKQIHLALPIDFILLKKMLKFGVKLAAANLVFLLSSNIVIFLLRSLDHNEFVSVGVFSRATAVANLFIIIPTSLGPLIYAKWSSMDAMQLRMDVERTLRLFFYLSCFVIVVLMLIAEDILTFLYGGEFKAAAEPLKLLSWSFLFSSFTIVLTNMFASIGKPQITLRVFVESLILSTMIGAFLIPILSINGAALALTLGVAYNALRLYHFSNLIVDVNFMNFLKFERSDLKLLFKAIGAKLK